MTTEAATAPEVEAADAATPEQLSTIIALSRQQAKLQAEVTRAEETLRTAKDALKHNAEIALPNALRNANLDALPLGEGWMVRLKTTLAGTITEANKAAAHEWLEAHGMGGIIKHVITISFGRDEDAFFNKFLRDLAKRKRPVDAERKDAVNTSTLGATIREQVAKAKDAGLDPREAIPFDLFGVYQMTTAELIAPKTKKVTL
jgi:hypothetical protein